MKHEFSGIGEKSATVTMMLLASTPLNFLAVGFWGNITHWLLTRFYMWLASNGLTLLNVGIANLQVASERAGWDAAVEEAWKIVEQRSKELTNAQKKKVDDRVRAAHRKFASFGVRP